jgi:hypothetical protein
MAGNAEHSLALRSNAISVRSGQRGGIGVDGVPPHSLIGLCMRLSVTPRRARHRLGRPRGATRSLVTPRSVSPLRPRLPTAARPRSAAEPNRGNRTLERPKSAAKVLETATRLPNGLPFTDSAGRIEVIGSPWRCVTFQVPSSLARASVWGAPRPGRAQSPGHVAAQVARARSGSKHHLIACGRGSPLAASLTGGKRNDVTPTDPARRCDSALHP